MITLPPGFDAAAFASELYSAAAPFAAIAFMIAVGFMLIRILNRF